MIIVNFGGHIGYCLYCGVSPNMAITFWAELFLSIMFLGYFPFSTCIFPDTKEQIDSSITYYVLC